MVPFVIFLHFQSRFRSDRKANFWPCWCWHHFSSTYPQLEIKTPGVPRGDIWTSGKAGKVSRKGREMHSNKTYHSSRHVVEVVLRSSLTFENNVKQMCEFFQERREFMNCLYNKYIPRQKALPLWKDKTIKSFLPRCNLAQGITLSLELRS